MDLPEAQRASLEALTRQDGYDGSVPARAQIVLWRADGLSVGDIVRMSGASKPTVYKWLDRYERLGVDGLIEKYRAEHDLVDAQGKLISDDELVKLNEQLSIARARTIELNARAQSTRQINVEAVLGGGLPEELASSVMSELRSQYAATKREADQLSVRLGPRHPQYLAMQAQLSRAREQIANELRRIVASVQTDLKRAVQQEQDLAARLAQLKLRSGDVNVDLVTLRELEREAAAKRAVYEGYLLRARETGEQRDINTANMSVISQAFPPIDPTGPSRATIALGGMILGFIAGIGLGILRGIVFSLRNAGRSGPCDRATGGAAAPDLSAVQSAAAVPAFRHPEPLPADPAPAMQEAAMNPLARLMEGMRRPAPAGNVDAAPTPPVVPPYTAYPMIAPLASAAEYPQAAQPSYAPAAEPYPASLRELSPIDEVRESLREFRDAVRDLAESRARRSY